MGVDDATARARRRRGIPQAPVDSPARAPRSGALSMCGPGVASYGAPVRRASSLPARTTRQHCASDHDGGELACSWNAFIGRSGDASARNATMTPAVRSKLSFYQLPPVLLALSPARRLVARHVAHRQPALDESVMLPLQQRGQVRRGLP